VTYWVSRRIDGTLKRVSGPHYAVASAWDAHGRITSSDTVTPSAAAQYVVVDEYDNEQQRTEPKRFSR
jgi:hypothetical protein